MRSHPPSLYHIRHIPAQRRRLVLLILAMLLLFWPQGPAAAFNSKDLQVISQALAFRENAPANAQEIGILVDPATPASLREATELESALGGGLTVGGRKVPVRLVDVKKLAEAGSLLAILIPDGNRDAYPAIATALGHSQILTIGGDAACATSGACILSAWTGARTEILVNRQRAEAAGVRFATAFRLLVQEI